MTEYLRQSVTKDDHNVAKQEGAYAVVIGNSGILGPLLEGYGISLGQSGLPPYGTPRRDTILSLTPFLCGPWASAVVKAITKTTALGYTLSDVDDSQRRLKAAQELLTTFGGSDSGWVRSMSLVLRDYLLRNNGAFVEVVWSGTRPVALFPLNAAQCTRTNDPKRPVVYTDLKGRQHLLDEHEVLVLEDSPQPHAAYGYLGQCAADRAWSAVMRRAAVDTYFQEKITGDRSLAIHFINGVAPKVLENALGMSRAEQESKGFLVYRGSTLITTTMGQAPQVVSIPLAEIPDGFDAETERQDTTLQFALALGLDPQELGYQRPSGLNSGSATATLLQATKTAGLASFRKQFEHLITHRVLAKTTTFAFVADDTPEKRARWEADDVRIKSLVTLAEKQILRPEQVINLLVDDQILPAEMLPRDVTDQGTITDNAKVAPTDAQREDVPALPLPSEPVATKARRKVEAADVEAILKQAAKLAGVE